MNKNSLLRICDLTKEEIFDILHDAEALIFFLNQAHERTSHLHQHSIN